MTTAHEQTYHHLADLLARLAATRDPEAWTALLVTAGPEMQRLARRIIGEAALADDGLQEALLQVRDHAGQFRPAESDDPDRDARRWILRVTSNSCLNILRSQTRARRRERDHGAERPVLPTPHETMERSEHAEILRRELALLPKTSSMAIVLHHIGGLSFEEIAAELGLPIGTAKTHVRRGLMALRQRLQRVGVVMSVAAVAGSLTALPAAEGAAPLLGYSSLLYSPVKAAAGAAMSMGVKAVVIGSLAAAGLGTGAVVMTRSDATPTATPTATVMPAPSAHAIIAFDFEDGKRPTFLLDGEVVGGPVRDGNKFCVMASDRIHKGMLQKEITFEPPRGVEFVSYEPGMRVEFDYWYTAESGKINVGGWSQAQSGHCFMNIDGPAQGQWAHMSGSFDDFRIASDPARGFVPGDKIGNLGIAVSARPSDVLYIDNFTITRP